MVFLFILQLFCPDTLQVLCFCLEITALSVEALRAMLAKVPDHVIVLVDEAYREFLDPSFGNPVSLLADHQNVVVSRTFSKAYGLAGVRVGYLVAAPAIVSAPS